MLFTFDAENTKNKEIKSLINYWLVLNWGVVSKPMYCTLKIAVRNIYQQSTRVFQYMVWIVNHVK